MTPELKTACEVVFQEHKTFTQSITWNKDAFRGRISIGLREMARETLVSKNVIFYPNKFKKTITVLNPDVAMAATFEEAIETAKQSAVEQPVVINHQPVVLGDDEWNDDHEPVPTFMTEPFIKGRRFVKITGNAETIIASEKWYMKPFFYYVIWPACALAAGVAVAWLMSEWVEMAWKK